MLQRFKLLAVMVLACGLALAQTGTRIAGTVRDSSQAVIPGAMVTAQNASTGVKRETTTDEQGRFAFPDLPVGTYTLVAQAKGFQGQAKGGIELNVATGITVEFVLSPGALTEVVQVDATVSTVEAAGGTLLGNRQIAQLPINGRDFTRFSLLTPGAVNATGTIANMTFNGMPFTSNYYSIDGITAQGAFLSVPANGFERGARLLTGSLDSIAEFRAQTSNYNAEFGRASGSSIAIVSKSGGNQVHGTIYEFLRNDIFDARNFFNVKPQPKPSFRYNDFGGNLGGPLVKDRTFFFANYEGARQALGIIGSGTVPSRSVRDQVLATSPALKPILDNIPLGTSPTSNPRVDNYVTQGVNRVREDTGNIKVDQKFSDNDQFYARLNINDTQVRGPLFTVFPTFLGINDFQEVPYRTVNLALNETHTFSPRVLLEVLVGVQRSSSYIDSFQTLPLTTITGYTIQNGNRLGQGFRNTTLQGGGNLSWVRGAHTIKFGTTVWRSESNQNTTPAVSLTFTSIDDFMRNSPAQSVVSAGNPGSTVRQTWVGSYAQDTWAARRGLTLNYGLRWDIGTPNHGPAGHYRTFDTRINNLGPAGGDWYRMNKKNFAPRLGLSWQPVKRIVVRAGYGIFYEHFSVGWGSSVASNTLPGNITLLRTAIPNLRYPVEPFVGAGSVALPNVGGFNYDHPEIYSQQWNLTLVSELSGGVSLQTAYVGNRGINLRRPHNINLIDPATGRRPFSQFGDITLDFTDGQSTYHGLQVTLNKRLAGGLQGAFNYTFSKALDNNGGDSGGGGAQIQDNRCWGRCERGLGSNDVRHNATYQVLYDLPFGIGKKFAANTGRLGTVLLSGWQISSLGLIRSGVPNNITIGVNTSGNGNFVNQRPDRVPGQPLFATSQTIDNWYNQAAFVIPVRGTSGNTARNTGRGPDFWQFDVSLMKKTPVTDRASLQLRAEVFNVFNRPNFAQPNGVFGTANFGRIFNTAGRTLGFGTSRQIQLSLRLEF